MKTLIPALFLLACMITSCKKVEFPIFPENTSMWGQLQPYRVVTATGIKSDPSGAFNGFVVNGEPYDAYYMGKTLASHEQFWFQSDQNEGATFTCNTKNPIPAADGVYTYRLGEDLNLPDVMQIGCFLNSMKEK